jgi:hypothetical protein
MCVPCRCLLVDPPPPVADVCHHTCDGQGWPQAAARDGDRGGQARATSEKDQIHHVRSEGGYGGDRSGKGDVGCELWKPKSLARGGRVGWAN